MLFIASVDREGRQTRVETKLSWVGTSSTVKDITTKFPNVRKAL
jgi:hypothetical protein